MAIKPDGPIYDYTARYTAGLHVHGPGRTAREVLAECARVAVRPTRPSACEDLSRSDLIVRDDGTVCFLEVNVARVHRDLASPPSRPPVSTWATCWPRWSGPRRRARPDTLAMSELTYSTIIRLAWLGFRVLGQKITLTGLEHVPRTGGALVAVNHIGYVDFVYAGIPIDKVGVPAVHGQARALRPPACRRS